MRPALFIRACAAALAATALFSAHATQAAGDAPTRFSVTVEGSGPDVILIPGLASSAHVWDAEAAKLKDHYRLHLIQVAGFAGAPAGPNADGPIIQPTVDEIDAYIHANHLVHPAIIGHSMGGLMGMMLAKQHPGDLGKLMVVDSLPWFGLLAGGGDKAAQFATMMRDHLQSETQAAYAAEEPRMMARFIKTTGPQTDAAKKAAAESDHTVVARAMYEDVLTNLIPDLPGIKTPVVMLYPWDASSGESQENTDAFYQGAFAGLPNKTLIRVEGAYHFIQIDQPDRFDHEVQSFLKK